jgi:outer membrane protein assembly factor BamB
VKPGGGSRWSTSLSNAIGSFKATIDVAPLVSSAGTIFVAGANGYDEAAVRGRVWALDRSGKVLGEMSPGPAAVTSPALAAGGVLVFGTADGKLVAVKPAPW